MIQNKDEEYNEFLGSHVILNKPERINIFRPPLVWKKKSCHLSRMNMPFNYRGTILNRRQDTSAGVYDHTISFTPTPH